MYSLCNFVVFFFQAEDGIRDLVRSRGLGDVYKRQKYYSVQVGTFNRFENADQRRNEFKEIFGDGVHIKIEKSGSETIYKVMIGRYKAYDAAKPVSYTHLTLPTSDLV